MIWQIKGFSVSSPSIACKQDIESEYGYGLAVQIKQMLDDFKIKWSQIVEASVDGQYITLGVVQLLKPLYEQRAVNFHAMLFMMQCIVQGKHINI